MPISAPALRALTLCAKKSRAAKPAAACAAVSAAADSFAAAAGGELLQASLDINKATPEQIVAAAPLPAAAVGPALNASAAPSGAEGLVAAAAADDIFCKDVCDISALPTPTVSAGQAGEGTTWLAGVGCTRHSAELELEHVCEHASAQILPLVTPLLFPLLQVPRLTHD